MNDKLTLNEDFDIPGADEASDMLGYDPDAEPTLEDQGWEYVASKDVYDEDGFRDVYCWYRKDGNNRFFFSMDADCGDPEYFDWETEGDEAAQEWFDSYGEDEDKLTFVDNREEAILHNGDDPGFDEYDKVDEAVEDSLTAKAEIETPRGTFYAYKGTWKDFENEDDRDDWGFWFDHYTDDNKHFKIMHNHIDNSAIAVLKEGLNESKRGFVEKYRGYSIHDAGDRYVITDEKGLNVGETRFGIPVCRGMIDDMIDGKEADKITEAKRTKFPRGFNLGSSNNQNVKVRNPYNYTIQELSINNKAKTFERGNFSMGRADIELKNRQEYEDIVDLLKDQGYTEVKSDYHSLRNKTRKGIREGVLMSDKVDKETARKEYESGKPIYIGYNSSREAMRFNPATGETFDEVVDHMFNGEKDLFFLVDHRPLTKDHLLDRIKERRKTVSESAPLSQRKPYRVFIEGDRVKIVNSDGWTDSAKHFVGRTGVITDRSWVGSLQSFEVLLDTPVEINGRTYKSTTVNIDNIDYSDEPLEEDKVDKQGSDNFKFIGNAKVVDISDLPRIGDTFNGGTVVSVNRKPNQEGYRIYEVGVAEDPDHEFTTSDDSDGGLDGVNTAHWTFAVKPSLKESLDNAEKATKEDILEYAKLHGDRSAADLLLLGGYEFFDGTADEYDALLKELEGKADGEKVDEAYGDDIKTISYKGKDIPVRSGAWQDVQNAHLFDKVDTVIIDKNAWNVCKDKDTNEIFALATAETVDESFNNSSSSYYLTTVGDMIDGSVGNMDDEDIDKDLKFWRTVARTFNFVPGADNVAVLIADGEYDPEYYYPSWTNKPRAIAKKYPNAVFYDVPFFCVKEVKNGKMFLYFDSEESAKKYVDLIDSGIDFEDQSNFDNLDESLNEDTVKQGSSWVNKGKEGTHGKFKTKKEADAQRKAMFANKKRGAKWGESLEEDASTVNPGTADATFIANYLVDAINGEWDTIKLYNSIVEALKEANFTDIIPVIQDIVEEENVHVGQLQKALETISPDTAKIQSGEVEADGQLQKGEEEESEEPTIESLKESIGDDDWDDFELAGIYGGDLTYCPICGRRLQYDEDGDSFCPKCEKSAWELAQERRKLDKEHKNESVEENPDDNIEGTEWYSTDIKEIPYGKNNKRIKNRKLVDVDKEPVRNPVNEGLEDSKENAAIIRTALASGSLDRDAFIDYVLTNTPDEMLSGAVNFIGTSNFDTEDDLDFLGDGVDVTDSFADDLFIDEDTLEDGSVITLKDYSKGDNAMLQDGDNSTITTVQNDSEPACNDCDDLPDGVDITLVDVDDDKPLEEEKPLQEMGPLAATLLTAVAPVVADKVMDKVLPEEKEEENKVDCEVHGNAEDDDVDIKGI